MNKICLILPYFGKNWPETFPILVESIHKNANVDFLILSNLKIEAGCISSNMRVIDTTFENIVSKVDNILGYKSKLKNPYKLCDFKPMYGALFSEYTESYDWWGYFDSDLIFGDLSIIINEEHLEQYDRFFSHGHLMCFKNNEKLNYLWEHNFSMDEVPSFKEVSTSSTVFAFDEWGWGKNRGRGISYALDKSKLIKQFDDDSMFADINKDEFNFCTSTGQPLDYFKFIEGHAYGIYNGIQKEYAYVHFQKRNVILQTNDFENDFFVRPNVVTKSEEIDLSAEFNRWNSDSKKKSGRNVVGI